MPCHAMHPIQDLFLESFSYVLQLDMHFICTPMWTKFYSCKKWVLHHASSLAKRSERPVHPQFSSLQNVPSSHLYVLHAKTKGERN
jgi:hypothetical protein